MGFLNLGVFTTTILIPLVLSIGIKEHKVPRSPVLGSNPVISCEYTLDPAEEISYFKWSRDSQTFFVQTFKKLPEKGGQLSLYPVYGMAIQNPRDIFFGTNKTTIVLNDADFATGGNYVCEVGSYNGGPPATLDLDMSVIAIPEPNPVVNITGFNPRFQYGDILQGNCTFTDSYPEAELTFYLNGKKLEGTNNPDVEVTVLPRIRNGSRYIVVLGLFIRATTDLIPPIPRTNILKCEATLLDRNWNMQIILRRV